jgi:hypothetical protein
MEEDPTTTEDRNPHTKNHTTDMTQWQQLRTSKRRPSKLHPTQLLQQTTSNGSFFHGSPSARPLPPPANISQRRTQPCWLRIPSCPFPAEKCNPRTSTPGVHTHTALLPPLPSILGHHHASLRQRISHWTTYPVDQQQHTAPRDCALRRRHTVMHPAPRPQPG